MSHYQADSSDNDVVYLSEIKAEIIPIKIEATSPIVVGDEEDEDYHGRSVGTAGGTGNIDSNESPVSLIMDVEEGDEEERDTSCSDGNEMEQERESAVSGTGDSRGQGSKSPSEFCPVILSVQGNCEDIMDGYSDDVNKSQELTNSTSYTASTSLTASSILFGLKKSAKSTSVTLGSVQVANSVKSQGSKSFPTRTNLPLNTTQHLTQNNISNSNEVSVTAPSSLAHKRKQDMVINTPYILVNKKSALQSNPPKVKTTVTVVPSSPVQCDSELVPNTPNIRTILSSLSYPAQNGSKGYLDSRVVDGNPAVVRSSLSQVITPQISFSHVQGHVVNSTNVSQIQQLKLTSQSQTPKQSVPSISATQTRQVPNVTIVMSQQPPHSNNKSKSSTTATFTSSKTNSATEKSIERDNAIPPITIDMLSTGAGISKRIEALVSNVMDNLWLDVNDLEASDMLSVPTVRAATDDKFCCSVCGDVFLTKDGLQWHLRRNVFQLEYDCVTCKNKQTFNNKCSFWLHVRKESPTSQLSDLSVRLKSRQPGAHLFDDWTEDSNSKAASMTSQQVRSEKLGPVFEEHETSTDTIVTASSTPEAVSNSQETISDQASLKNSVCPFCKGNYKTDKGLQNHLQKKAPIHISSTLVCGICQMNLPNVCALSLHDALHKEDGTRSSLCPECGMTLYFGRKHNVQSFEHLDQCLHFNRTLAFVCRCNQVFSNETLARHHFIKNHLKTLYLCTACSKAYSDLDQCANHLKVAHKKVFIFLRNHLMCTFCNVLHRDTQGLKKHLDFHFHDQSTFNTREFCWKCFICSGTFTNSDDLKHHAEKDHVYKAKRCTLCHGLFSSRKLLVEHIMSKKCQTHRAVNLSKCLDMESSDAEPIDYGSLITMRPVKVFDPKTIHVVSTNSVSLLTGQQKSGSNDPSVINALKAMVTAQKSPVSIQPRTVEQGSPQARLPTPASLSSNVNLVFSGSNFLQRPNISIASTIQVPRYPSSSSHRLPVSSSGNTGSALHFTTHPVLENRSKLLQSGASSSQTGASSSKSGAFSSRTGDNIAKVSTKSQSQLAARYQCHACKIIILGKENYVEHLKKHAMKGKYISQDVTRCLVCKILVLNKNLKAHLLKHQSCGIAICVCCQRRNFKTIGQAKHHASILCGYDTVEGAGELREDVTQNTNNNAQSLDNESDEEMTSPIEVSTDNEDLQEEHSGLFPCLLCGLAFHTKSDHHDHVSRMHDGTRTVYYCLLCKKKGIEKLFKRKQLVSKHVQTKHKISEPSEINKHIQLEERSSTSGKQLTTPETTTSQNNDGPSAPKRLRIQEEGDFLCGKCAFSCNESSEFATHILTHNTKKDPQCPECGLCFIVISALKKHLFAVHKIKQVEEFLKSRAIELCEEEEDEDDMVEMMLPAGVHCRSPVVAVESDDEEEPKRPRQKSSENALECTVCYRVFDQEHSLKKHMRNHGMAFIRSKRSKV